MAFSTKSLKIFRGTVRRGTNQPQDHPLRLVKDISNEKRTQTHKKDEIIIMTKTIHSVAKTNPRSRDGIYCGYGVATAVRIVVQPNHPFPDMRTLISILNDPCQIFVDGLSVCFQKTKCVCLLGVREYVLHSCSLGILDGLGLASTSHTEYFISPP